MLLRKRRATSSNQTGLNRRSRIGRVLLSVAIAIPTIVFTLGVGAQPANASGSGLNIYWKNEAGSTTGITRNEFTTGTCAETVSNINFAWSSGAPSYNSRTCNSDGFTTFATGYISAFNTSDQTMYFCDQSDDGFYLQINGTEVISNWAEQGPSTTCNVTGSFTFSANTVYTIKVWHHENGGGADMRLLWSTTASNYAIIPAANLATSASLLKPSFDSISSVIPNYDYGNNTYNFGPSISSSNCGAGQNSGCSYTVSGGTTAYTYSLSAGSLPSVLTVNSSSGSLVYNSSGTFTAGTYSNLKIKVTDANGMWAESTAFAITLNRRAISITASNSTKVYGANNPSLTGYTSSGSLQFTDTFTVSETTSATTTSGVGSYSIYPTASFGTLATQCSSVATNCYSITYNTGNLSVTTRPINVKANNASKNFGSSDPSPLTTYTLTGNSMAGSDTITVNYSRNSGEATTSTYTITPSVSTSTPSNYAVTTDTGTFSIAPAGTVTLSVTNPSNVTFTGNPVTVNKAYTVTGLATGDSITSVSWLYSGTANDGSYSANNSSAPTNAGTYTLSSTNEIFSITGGSANYSSFVKNAGSFTILRKVPNLSLYYTNSGGLTNNTVYYQGYGFLDPVFDLDGSPSPNKSFTTTTPSVCSVNSVGAIINTYLTGTCTVVFATTQSYNYDTASVTVNISILVAPRTLSASVGSATRKYGETTTVTATPSDGSTDGTKSFYTSTGSKCSVDTNSGLVTIIGSSGTCSVYAKISTGSKYDSATSSTASITLSKADTVTINANNISAVTYTPTGATFTPNFTATGLQNSDTITVSSSAGYIYKSYTSQTCAQGGYCKIGDTGPGGGKVFYVDYSFNMDTATFSVGGHYLEAAPAAASSSASWCSIYNMPDSRTVATTGYGAANTAAMISWCSGSASSPAANAARNYRGPNSLTDWFIPSLNELALMVSDSNRTMVGLTTGTYWSSTRNPNGNSQACAVDASTQTQYCNMAQPSSIGIWAIRAFSNTYGPSTYYGPSNTKPTNAGTYSITVDSSTVTWSYGSPTDYQGATYDIGLITINKATNTYLKANQNTSTLTWSYDTSLNIFATSDGGETTTATFNITNGANSTCSLSGTTAFVTNLSATATGTNNAVCLIYLTRVATDNYNAITGDTTTVTFIRFVVNNPVSPAIAGGGNIAVGIGGPYTETVTVSTDANKTPKITGVINQVGSTTINAGDTITVSGSFFLGVNLIQFLGGGSDVPISPSVSNASSFTFTLPMDVASGPMMVVKPTADGRGVLAGRYNLTITP